jgi:hypothetical protein
VHAKPDESLYENPTTASAMVNQALATTTSAQMHPHIAMLTLTIAQVPCHVYYSSANDTLRCLSHHLRRCHETMKEKWLFSATEIALFLAIHCFQSITLVRYENI